MAGFRSTCMEIIGYVTRRHVGLTHPLVSRLVHIKRLRHCWWAAPLIFLTDTVTGRMGCIPICGLVWMSLYNKCATLLVNPSWILGVYASPINPNSSIIMQFSAAIWPNIIRLVHPLWGWRPHENSGSAIAHRIKTIIVPRIGTRDLQFLPFRNKLKCSSKFASSPLPEKFIKSVKNHI